MNRELTERIVGDFPELFRDYGRPITDTCISWGCEHGDGWEPLLRRACVQLAALHPPPVLDQVKEKYGGLRMYYHGGPEVRRRWWWPVLLPAGLAVGLWRCLRPRYRWPWRTFHVSVWQATFWLHHDPAGDIVATAEAESYRTCEVCGRPGRPNDGGWISTLCDQCTRAQWRAR